jgi:hypothetical protein
LKTKTTVGESPLHSPILIIPYCAGCDRDWEPDPHRRLGQRFLCPSEVTHVAALVKGDVGKLWLRIEARILSYEFLSLRLSGRKMPIALAIRVLVLGLALALCPWGAWERAIASLLGVAVIADTMLIATSVAFFSRFPAHPLRSILNALISAALTATAFGVLYASSVDGFTRGTAPMTLPRVDAVYFSFVTIATLGYGDIHPSAESLLPKLLIISELLVGLYLLATILAIHASWVSALPSITEPPTYSALFPERHEAVPSTADGGTRDRSTTPS